jgi:hypothetical protein
VPSSKDTEPLSTAVETFAELTRELLALDKLSVALREVSAQVGEAINANTHTNPNDFLIS